MTTTHFPLSTREWCKGSEIKLEMKVIFEVDIKKRLTQKLFLGKCHSSSGVDLDTKAKGYTSNCHHVWPYDMHKAERYGRYDKLLSHKPGSLIQKK